MPDIIALGELLIDFVPTISGVTLIEAPAFKKAPGGAPANVAAGVAKLGVQSGFMGKVGDDAFGHFLAGVMEEVGVDISRLRFSNQARTALAFVSLRADGEREFMFYRHPSADMLYTPEEVDVDYIRSAKIFNYGSISLINEPERSATLRALEVAQVAGLLVSYDPNLRLALWPNAAAAWEGMRLGWSYAHVIKISEEELEFLTGKSIASLQDLKGLETWHHPGLQLLVVTCGKDGCTALTSNFRVDLSGFSVEAVDTTGAGDGFTAGLLCGLLGNPAAWEDASTLCSVCRYANAVGALTTTERGAVPALPTAAQVNEFLARQ